MRKVFLTWKKTESLVSDICRQIDRDMWLPDYVVGITRGGLVPANLISQYLDVAMHTLKVSLRNDGDCESNLWMAEDAAQGKKILIVDDINDTGSTINWIKQDWGADIKWGDNVKVAVLIDNESSDSELVPNYSAENINKASDPCWIVFPWEEWWKNE